MMQIQVNRMLLKAQKQLEQGKVERSLELFAEGVLTAMSPLLLQNFLPVIVGNLHFVFMFDKAARSCSRACVCSESHL